jgi:hypothetical protein
MRHLAPKAELPIIDWVWGCAWKKKFGKPGGNAGPVAALRMTGLSYGVP